MTEVVTKQLTCAGPPIHTWTGSRPKGTPGAWPHRCPVHKSAHLRAADRKYKRAQRGSTKEDEPVVEAPVAEHTSNQLAKVLGVSPTTTSGGDGKVTVIVPSGSGAHWPGSAPLLEGKVPEDLQYLAKVADEIVPNRKAFRALMRRAMEERTERAYLNLAAACLAAARLLSKHATKQQGPSNGGSQ